MIQLKNAYGAYAGTLTPKTSDMKIPQVFHGINAEVDAPPINNAAVSSVFGTSISSNCGEYIIPGNAIEIYCSGIMILIHTHVHITANTSSTPHLTFFITGVSSCFICPVYSMTPPNIIASKITEIEYIIPPTPPVFKRESMISIPLLLL